MYMEVNPTCSCLVRQHTAYSSSVLKNNTLGLLSEPRLHSWLVRLTVNQKVDGSNPSLGVFNLHCKLTLKNIENI